jgi:hypothetical protein
MLAAAGERATLEGRSDVAEYLRLKATNDAIRATGVKWLIDAFIEVAFTRNPSFEIERLDGHTFPYGASTMSGTRLDIRHGVRCLTVEGGWTRLPADGVMRGAALARANILHFGRRRNDASLRLVAGTDLPEWITDDGGVFRVDGVRRHISLLQND